MGLDVMINKRFPKCEACGYQPDRQELFYSGKRFIRGWLIDEEKFEENLQKFYDAVDDLHEYPVVEAIALLKKCEKYINSEDYDQAMAVLNKALKEDPTGISFTAWW